MKSVHPPVPAKTWRQTPLKLTVIIAMEVAAVATVVMAGTTAALDAVAGTVAGAAAGAGLCTLRSLWKPEVRAVAAMGAAAVAAVTGGLAGTAAAAILQSLVRTQTGSALVGAMAGAAIVAVVRPQLQWLINVKQWATDAVKWVLAQVKKVKAAEQRCTEVEKEELSTVKVIVGSGLATVGFQADEAASRVAGSAASGSTVGVAAAEAVASGLIGGLGVLGERSGMNGSQQEEQSQTQAAVMVRVHILPEKLLSPLL